MLDTAHLDYDGNSQGGIMGIMLAAVSPDIERAVLGVPGINYSLLLPRSVDFDDYEAIFKPAYPNDLDRMIIIGLLQMLWDRGEGGGYVQHLIDDPYADTPAKTVLLDVAFGDWQVSELSAMVAARTIGAHDPPTGHRRGPQPRRSIPVGDSTTTEYPSDGSAIVIWDSGSDPIPIPSVPPSTGRDPHDDPRADPDVRDAEGVVPVRRHVDRRVRRRRVHRRHQRLSGRQHDWPPARMPPIAPASGEQRHTRRN